MILIKIIPKEWAPLNSSNFYSDLTRSTLPCAIDSSVLHWCSEDGLFLIVLVIRNMFSYSVGLYIQNRQNIFNCITEMKLTGNAKKELKKSTNPSSSRNKYS